MSILRVYQCYHKRTLKNIDPAQSRVGSFVIVGDIVTGVIDNS